MRLAPTWASQTPPACPEHSMSSGTAWRRAVPEPCTRRVERTAARGAVAVARRRLPRGIALRAQTVRLASASWRCASLDTRAALLGTLRRTTALLLLPFFPFTQSFTFFHLCALACECLSAPDVAADLEIMSHGPILCLPQEAVCHKASCSSASSWSLPAASPALQLLAMSPHHPHVFPPPRACTLSHLCLPLS